MNAKTINPGALDHILETMVSTVDRSKDEIFTIGEQCRKDFLSLTEELDEIRRQVKEVIDENDDLDIKYRFARKRLAEVSQHFKTYSEDQIRDAYEKAHDFQMKLTVNAQKEHQLRQRRDDLERRMITLQETIDRADRLVSQISVVLNYLVTDLKQVGEALEDAKQKQDFGLKIIEAQEEERRKLSREIHDGPAQMLANVLMRSDLIERVYRERGSDAAFGEIRSLKQMVRSALYEVRRIIYDLRPMALDDLGLVPTLKKYLETTQEYNEKTQIHFVNFGEIKRLPPKHEVALFRLIQESVQNSLKHAKAREIHVKLELKRDVVQVVVKDNGVGFDQTQKKEGSFGLMGMKERVDLLNGELSIDSKLGEGTIVMIQVPLSS
ncbi:sensor histidine kinase [Mangrovibacillus cuniculi]|uniref:Signal transduction histidine-protein kinase/phosphatase DegS n=1 Tax=Mangrovibacillus cuniculi TaxID=2593652 RepID=A0A7S8HG23_9BACI|nr:sensor histidine kinase [Mangrovibacillus cuniculi]QPC47524.1 histidine kinase [Mangrovibacillus cuniculi]